MEVQEVTLRGDIEKGHVACAIQYRRDERSSDTSDALALMRTMGPTIC